MAQNTVLLSSRSRVSPPRITDEKENLRANALSLLVVAGRIERRQIQDSGHGTTPHSTVRDVVLAYIHRHFHTPVIRIFIGRVQEQVLSCLRGTCARARVGEGEKA